MYLICVLNSLHENNYHLYIVLKEDKSTQYIMIVHEIDTNRLII